MIAEFADKVLRRFEERNCQPAIIKKAGGFLHRLVEQGMHSDFIETIQKRRLTDTIDYVVLHSSFYKRMFSEYGLRPH